MLTAEAPIIASGGEPMKIRLSNPGVADALREALEAADCVAERESDDTLDVDVGWINGGEGSDKNQARLELAFFVRAWEAQHPGLTAVVVEP